MTIVERVEHNVDKNLSKSRKEFFNNECVVWGVKPVLLFAPFLYFFRIKHTSKISLYSHSNADELALFPKTKIGVKCLSRDCLLRLNSNKHVWFFSLSCLSLSVVFFLHCSASPFEFKFIQSALFSLDAFSPSDRQRMTNVSDQY